jgi:predicted dithiol-disulfide oxidoreductase (DUF899 family)
LSIADAVDAVLPHLQARDVTFVFVSQAPLARAGCFRVFLFGAILPSSP